MTTCGYGDIHPTTSKERLIQIIIMITASGVFAFFLGDIGKIVKSFNDIADTFREKMLYVEQFLRHKNIP